jgi:hypothetical protein
MNDQVPFEILEAQSESENFVRRECAAVPWEQSVDVDALRWASCSENQRVQSSPTGECRAGVVIDDAMSSSLPTGVANRITGAGSIAPCPFGETARDGDGLTSSSDPVSRIDFFDPPLAQPPLNRRDAHSDGSSVGQANTLEPIHQTAGASSSDAPAVRFCDLTDQQQRAKVLWRETVVTAILAAEAAGASRRQAVLQTLARPQFAGASRAAAYLWVAHYHAAGIDGLVEQKLGRSGRRSFISRIPKHLLEAARAAACEHGTAGADGRQNFARAVRSTLLGHPELPVDVARHLHTEHASKSYVPASLRGALRVSPLARAVVQGPHAAALATPCIVTSCDTQPGRVATADDMTANVYCWCGAPNELGYIVGRPQILAWLDVGSHRWLLLRTIMRASGQYTRDDVWGGIGDVMSQYGVYPEWLFESGIWRSNLIIGERTGLSDDERFGGLKSLGCVLHRSLRPQSKPIEQAFDQLQARSDRFPGYCGRDERSERSEALDKILGACKRGQMHPSQVLPHLSQYARHVESCAAELNGERQDGRTLRGASPDEAWNVAQVQLPALPPTAAWMFRSAVSRVTVRRDGMIRCTLRSGKYLEEYHYRNPEILMPRCGQTLIAYWNDRNPQADAVLMTAAKRPEFVGAAQYVEPISRFDATDEQLRREGQAKRAAVAYARAEVSTLQPHFQRSASRVQSLPAPVVHQVAEIGEQMHAAQDRAEAAQTAVTRARAVDAEGLLARRAAQIEEDE